MTKKITTLISLTGLEPDDLAEVLSDNPRAYMAVKGAVAEKHLELYLQSQKAKGHIIDFRRGQSDFEKDYYVKLVGVPDEVVIECKNVQVLDVKRQRFCRTYLQFLEKTGRIEPLGRPVEELSSPELKAEFDKLPQAYRESGLARYEFSAQLMTVPFSNIIDIQEFLEQFIDEPLSIDFQRTRNSRDDSDGTSHREARYYKFTELDVVAACLFSRTLNWRFIFASSSDLDPHPDFSHRIHSKLVISPNVWFRDVGDAIKRSLATKSKKVRAAVG